MANIRLIFYEHLANVDVAAAARQTLGETTMTTRRKPTGEVPATMAGRVIGRLADIETWFRAGFKTREVHARLANDGIRLHPVNLSALLSRYGKSEAQVRRAVANESRATNNTATRPPIAETRAARPIVAPRPPQRENKPPATKAGNTTAATVALKQREAARGRTFRPDPSPRAEDLI